METLTYKALEKYTKHDQHKQHMESYNKKQCAPTDNTNVRPISMETKQSIASMGIVLSIQADVKASLLEVRRNCHCCDNHCCDIVATGCFRRTAHRLLSTNSRYLVQNSRAISEGLHVCDTADDQA